MQRFVLSAVVGAIAGAALLSAGTAQATVLTFNQIGISNGAAINQAYGDNVTALTDAVGGYSQFGEGFTPNVTVEYFGSAQIELWTTGYDNLTNVFFDNRDADGAFGLILTAAPGFQVTLESFDLGSFSGAGGQVLAGIDVTGGDAPFSLTDTLIGLNNLSSTFTPGVSGSILTLTLDTTGLGAGADNIGLDNVVFSQSVATAPPETPAVPLPAPALLLGAGLAGLFAAARRRA